MNRPSSGPDLFCTTHGEEPANPAVSPDNIVLAGPPGSGKSTLGKALAERLGRPFASTDEIIEARNGKSIEQIFEQQGESAFRRLEREVCLEAAALTGHIIAVGGGALLDPESRSALEAGGVVVVLECDTAELIDRLKEGGRPLLGSNPSRTLPALLEKRREHYSSFPVRVNVTGKGLEDCVSDILAAPGIRQVHSLEIRQDPPSQLLIGECVFKDLDAKLNQLDLQPPFTVISDSNTGPLYGQQIAEHLGATHFEFPAGEKHKTLETLSLAYNHLYTHRMERRGTIIAVGGGVTGDLGGMAAATYLRGIRWVNVATSLLAMVDSSLGGKVAVDLPQGKNLVGAFHNPALILSDTRVLQTLPAREFRCGMAELIKAAVIADPLLFGWLEQGAKPSPRWIQRAIQVKADIVEEDPLEKGIRASLNFGHTIGHSIEAASQFTVSHGEGVAVGMIIESMLSEKLGLAQKGLTERIRRVAAHYGLPTTCAGNEPEVILDGLKSDKKNVNREPAFALPLRLGEVRIGCRVPRELILETLTEMQE